MTYGVAAPKLPCVYVTDDLNHLSAHHTQDIITAGSFAPGVGVDGELPSKGRLRQRHLGLLDKATGRRCKLPIGTLVALSTYELGATVAYGGINWTVTSRNGEKVTNRP